MKQQLKAQKNKKPLTCKICGKKFSYTAKSHPLGRLSKHIKSEHPSAHKSRINKAKRTRKKGDTLDKELQFTDDMILQSLMNAGIPIYAPQQNQPIIDPYSPTQHQSIAGALITAYKLGQAGYTAYKGVKAVSKAVKSARGKKK